MSSSDAEKIKKGALATAGVYAQDEIDKACGLLAEFSDQSIETVRLVFVDQHGILRGKTLVTSALVSAFASGIGMPSTLLLKDTAHKTVFPVWSDDVSIGEVTLQGASDVLAVPDPNTATKVPWSPHSRMILCDILDQNKAPVTFASRHVLRQALTQLDAKGCLLYTSPSPRD